LRRRIGSGVAEEKEGIWQSGRGQDVFGSDEASVLQSDSIQGNASRKDPFGASEFGPELCFFSHEVESSTG